MNYKQKWVSVMQRLKTCFIQRNLLEDFEKKPRSTFTCARKRKGWNKMPQLILERNLIRSFQRKLIETPHWNSHVCGTFLFVFLGGNSKHATIADLPPFFCFWERTQYSHYTFYFECSTVYFLIVKYCLRTSHLNNRLQYINTHIYIYTHPYAHVYIHTHMSSLS